MNATISEKGHNVLRAIAVGNSTRELAAAALGVSIATVNGSLTSLKRNGLIEVSDAGQLTLTEDAAPFVKDVLAASKGPRAARTGTKMEKAKEIFQRLIPSGRPAVLDAFRKEVGLTKAGASTYFQMLRAQSGMAQGVAFQKKAVPVPVPKATKAAKKEAAHA
jgi:DNA-binding transcriptional ArsR family regulator